MIVFAAPVSLDTGDGLLHPPPSSPTSEIDSGETTTTVVGTTEPIVDTGTGCTGVGTVTIGIIVAAAGTAGRPRQPRDVQARRRGASRARTGRPRR